MAEDREVSSETDAHPEGLDLAVLYSAVPLHDAAGRVVGALEVITDQTALRRAGDRPPDDDRGAGPECRTCLVR
jgi:methyl-accepting chemotaxis protein